MNREICFIFQFVVIYEFLHGYSQFEVGKDNKMEEEFLLEKGNATELIIIIVFNRLTSDIYINIIWGMGNKNKVKYYVIQFKYIKGRNLHVNRSYDIYIYIKY